MRRDAGGLLVAALLAAILCGYFSSALRWSREAGEQRARAEAAEALAERMAGRLRACEAEIDRMDSLP